MNFAQYIKEIGRGAEGAADLSEEDAARLYGAILDGGVPDLELGAIILALRMKGETPVEMMGFMKATDERTHALRRPAGRIRPLVLPSYNGARKGANLTPLLALLLQRFGVPVLVHGLLEGFGRVTSGHVFRELGIMPCISPAQVQQAMDQEGLAFAPLSVFSRGLSDQLALRSRLGLRNCAHSLVKLLDPFRGDGVLVAAATHPPYLDMMRELLQRREQDGLLLRATEGEPFANPKRRPKIEYVRGGEVVTLFEAEYESIKSLPHLPEEADARTTALWMRRVLGEHLPLPLPLANQLACCLFASGYAEEFNQAKAIVAVEGKALGLNV